MCDCLDNIIKKVKTDLDPEAKVDTAFVIVENKMFLRPTSMTLKYRKKKKDGTFEKRFTNSFIAFSHCPFCGLEYEQGV